MTKPVQLPAPTQATTSSTQAAIQRGNLRPYGGREWVISKDLHPNPNTAHFLAENFAALSKPSEAWTSTLVDVDAGRPSEPEYQTVSTAKTDGASFKGVNLSGYTFEYVVFANADFSGANFRGTTFYKSRFVDCRFTGVNMSEAKIVGCVIKNPQSGEEGLTAPNFSGAEMFSTRITSTTPATGLHGANFQHVDFDFCNIENASLVGARFECAQIAELTFTNCNLTNAKFDGIRSSDFRLADSDIRGATFVRAQFTRVRMNNVYASLDVHQRSDIARSEPPCFDRANFQYAVIRGCVLPGASFVGATLLDVVPVWGHEIPLDPTERPAWYSQLAAEPEDKVRHVPGDLRWADFRGAHIDRSAFIDFRFGGAMFADDEEPSVDARIDGSGFIRCQFEDAAVSVAQGFREDELVHCTSAEGAALAPLVARHAPTAMPATWPPGFCTAIFPPVAPPGAVDLAMRRLSGPRRIEPLPRENYPAARSRA